MKDIYDRIRFNQEESKVLDECDKLSDFLSRYKTELYQMLILDDDGKTSTKYKDSYETCVFMIDSIEKALNEHKKEILIMLEDIREVLSNKFKYKHNDKEINYFKE